MTAPARAATPQNRPPQPTETVVDFSLVEKCIARTIETAEARKRIAPVIRAGDSFDRITAAVREEFIKTPLLLKCSDESITAAVVKIQRWRLEIGETAYLVPFKDRRNERWVCTPVRSYLGDIQILMDNGVARRVDAFCVYEKEPFEYRQGLNAVLEHRPLDPAERGKMIGAYAIIWLTWTNAKFQFLYLSEIDEIRQKNSMQWKDGPCPPWWAMKRAIKVTTKLLPKTANVQKALAALEDEDEEIGTRAAISTRSALASVAHERPEHVTSDGEDLSDPPNGAAASQARADTAGVPACPKCGGAMWDNREKKASGRFSAKAPDFGCKDKQCDGKIWHHKDDPTANPGAPASESEPPASAADEEYIDDRDLIEEPTKANPPGSLRHDVPKPGKVEDALGLPLKDQPKRPNRDALREG